MSIETTCEVVFVSDGKPSRSVHYGNLIPEEGGMVFAQAVGLSLWFMIRKNVEHAIVEKQNNNGKWEKLDSSDSLCNFMAAQAALKKSFEYKLRVSSATEVKNTIHKMLEFKNADPKSLKHRTWTLMEDGSFQIKEMHVQDCMQQLKIDIAMLQLALDQGGFDGAYEENLKKVVGEILNPQLE